MGFEAYFCFNVASQLAAIFAVFFLLFYSLGCGCKEWKIWF